MLIALDYDFTYSLDPDWWDRVIESGLNRGHKFVCVTGRDSPPVAPERGIPMPVVCSPSEFKLHAAMRAGYAPDVWIDDAPGTIEPARILDWQDVKPSPETVEAWARECIAEDWDDHVPGYYRDMNIERFAALAYAAARPGGI